MKQKIDLISVLVAFLVFFIIIYAILEWTNIARFLAGSIFGASVMIIYGEWQRKRREYGHLKAIYIELRERLKFLRDFKYNPQVITHIPNLPTSSWDVAKAAGIINPVDKIYIKLRDVYRGFRLINENVQVALSAVTSSRGDWDKIAISKMEMINRINLWLIPILNECIHELEQKLKIPGNEYQSK